MAANIQKRHTDFPALTGVRFVAVATIFLIHNNSVDRFGPVLADIFNEFHLSLNIFFVLSGLLITYNYGYKLELDKSSLINYFLRRFARIYPLFFLLTTFTFIIDARAGRGGDNLFGIYLLNITFLKAFSSKFIFTGLYPTWSLTVEETFYILSPLIFFFVKRKSLYLTQIFFFWIVGVLLYLFFTRFPIEGFFTDFRFVFFCTFCGRCVEFFIGIWLGFYLRKNPSLISSSSRATKTYAGLILMNLVVLLLVVISPGNESAPERLPGVFISTLVFPFCVGLFLYGLVTEESLVKQVLATRLFQLLGLGSYAFFLVHTGIVADWVYNHIPNNNLFLFFVAMYLIALILYFAIENPVKAFIYKRAGRV